MNSSNSPSRAPDANVEHERRRHHRVRAIFDEACVLIKPFFAADNHWGSVSLEHLAYRSVREHYPELTPVEVHVLVTACKRVYTQNSPGERS